MTFVGGTNTHDRTQKVGVCCVAFFAVHWGPLARGRIATRGSAFFSSHGVVGVFPCQGGSLLDSIGAFVDIVLDVNVHEYGHPIGAKAEVHQAGRDCFQGVHNCTFP